MYVKFLPSQYVFKYYKGKCTAQGVGLSFFFLERYTSACAVPVSNTDADFIFEEKTLDFQKITIQGQLTYRITDYQKISSAMDFTVNLRNKKYYSEPMQKLSKRMINIADVFIKSHISSMNLTETLQSSLKLASYVLEEMQNSQELKALGVAVTGFSVLKIAPTNETGRALEAGTREEILRQADDALYERRNASIEQERRVKENELNTEISVEEKKKKIRETQIHTKRIILEKEDEIAKIKTLGEAEREQLKIDSEIQIERKRKELAALRFENAKKEADAEAYRISAIMNAYGQLSTETLVALATLNRNPEMIIAQAFEKLAVNSDTIGTLNITPDLLESLTGGNKNEKSR